MNSNTSVIIGWITAAVLTVWGALIMTGVFWVQAEKSTRLVLGGIFVAYGLYRLIVNIGKNKADKLEEKREEVKKKTDKLLNRR